MNFVIYLFGSGLALYLGVFLVLSSMLLMTYSQRRWQRGLASIASLLGIILFGLSAAPLPYWFYGIAFGLSIAWLVVEQSKADQRRTIRTRLRLLTILVYLVALGLEVPYQFSPHINLPDNSPLYIIGDSVTAGVGEGEAETWPKLLARWHGVDVHDFSRMGATAASALRQAEQVPESGGMVLIEIGGNDLLGTTTASQFEAHLDALLNQVAATDRSILMFELPLPPLCNAYGESQRRLAAKYRVQLIPKRVFVSILTAPGATLDSLHLTQSGHDRMAQAVWNIIGQSSP